MSLAQTISIFPQQLRHPTLLLRTWATLECCAPFQFGPSSRSHSVVQLNLSLSSPKLPLTMATQISQYPVSPPPYTITQPAKLPHPAFPISTQVYPGHPGPDFYEPPDALCSQATSTSLWVMVPHHSHPCRLSSCVSVPTVTPLHSQTGPPAYLRCQWCSGGREGKRGLSSRPWWICKSGPKHFLLRLNSP